MAGQVQQGLGAHFHVPVAQQLLDLRHHRLVCRGGANGDGLAPNLGGRMLEQNAHRRVRGALMTDFKQAEGVEQLPGIGAGQVSGENLGGGAVQHRGGCLLGVQAVLPDAVVQRAHVMAAGQNGGRDPARCERQHHPGDTLRHPAPMRGEQQQNQAGQPVARPPDHRVDK
jgi:hypothetical protein